MANSQNEVGGNPEIGMQGDSLESASAQHESTNPVSNDAGSKDFFDQLDTQVNSQIQDDPEVTQNQTSGPEQVTHANQDTGSETQKQSADSTDWATRYKDSSREAVKWRDKYKEVEKFVPVLDAMKNDSGLVDHVRDYLENGGPPAKSVTERLNLDEDFVYDQQEAISDPESDSAKVMNAHVDSLVEQRVNSMIKKEQARSQQIIAQKRQQEEEIAFKTKHKMSDEDFDNFKAKAKTHKMTLEDINSIVNKDKVAANVVESSKKDMMNQMKNVRNMPTSASGANSQGNKDVSEDRNVFENILGFGDSVDNLFG